MGQWGHLAARIAVQRAPAAPVDRPVEHAAQAAHQAAVASVAQALNVGQMGMTDSAVYAADATGNVLVPTLGEEESARGGSGGGSTYNKKNS